MTKEKETVLNLYVNNLFNIYHSSYSLKKESPFTKIERFFALYDWINTSAYYKNLTDLKMLYDPSLSDDCSADYSVEDNIIRYKNSEAIMHELFHMSSNPYRNVDQNGLVITDQNYALDEGVTQYFTYLADPGKIRKEVYSIETLVVELIAHSYGLPIFKDYFTADYSSFLNNFLNPEQANRLFKKLDIHYHECNRAIERVTSSIIPKEQKLLQINIDQERLGLLQKEIIRDTITIVYENEVRKKINCLDELPFIVETAIKSRKIQDGYLAEYDLLKYALNIVKNLPIIESKKRR